MSSRVSRLRRVRHAKLSGDVDVPTDKVLLDRPGQLVVDMTSSTLI
jgi:hypothetical protein